jgi:TolB-like protein
MSEDGTILQNLKSRHVVRAAVAHVIVAWLFVQIADVVLPYLGIVDQPVRWALAVSIATFPVTLVLAWLLDKPWIRASATRVTAEIVVIALIAVLAGLWVRDNLPEAARTKTNIVILPFAHSGVAADQGLSRALAYEVMSLLTRTRSIDVIAFESSSSTTLQGLGTVAVANRLNVANLLSGSVSSAGDRMRIELQLLNAAGDALWESVIEDSVSNLFSVQEYIATEVESRLGSGAETTTVASVAAERCWMPTDPAALEQYYTARYYMEMRTDTPESGQQIAEAIQTYKDLIAQFPEFSEAYAGLAWALLYQATYDPENAVENPREEGARLAAIALEHCATLGEAMHILPNEFDHENHWIGAHQQLTAFIKMEPHKSENYQRLSRLYRDTGLLTRSLEVAQQNYALNPLSVRSIRELASALQNLGRTDEASEMYDLAIELGSTAPNFAAENARFNKCEDDDTECFVANLPEFFAPIKDRLLIIFRTPQNEADADESLRAAYGMLDENPDLTNMFNGASCRAEHLSPLFFYTWDRHLESGAYWFWPNVWQNSLGRDCNNVWSDPRFSELVEEVGLVQFWREVGWPEACRPEGEGFACGRDARSGQAQK